MWVLTWWNDGDVIIAPTLDDVTRIANMLDNRRYIGLTLFMEGSSIHRKYEARIVAMGGERLHVTYAPPDHEDNTHILIDPAASYHDSVTINLGELGAFEYPAQETVPRETAIEALLYFHRTQTIGGDGLHWVAMD